MIWYAKYFRACTLTSHMMNHYVVDQSVEFGFQTRLINTSVNHVMFCSQILSEESEEASHKCFLFSRIKNEKKYH